MLLNVRSPVMVVSIAGLPTVTKFCLYFEDEYQMFEVELFFIYYPTSV